MALQLRQNLNLRMEQKLKLTPQMIQSIEILLLPQMALEERIMNEVESNPVLELSDGVDMDGPEDGPPPIAASEIATETAWDRSDREDADWLFQHKAKHRDDDAPDKMEALAAAPNRAQSLAEFLIEQLRFQDIPPEVRELIPDICWQLDRRGYLQVPITEIVPESKLELAEQAWEWVRKCEPAGVGARDLKDCLLLQLAREPGDNSFEMALIRDHLEDMLKNRLPAISAATGFDIERLKQAVEVIATLDPKPGLPYGVGENTYVVPDVTVERDDKGEWVISIPDQHLPKVRINDAYYQLYEASDGDPKEKAYLKEKLSSAKFILDAVAQRKRTLLKIVTEIIKHQHAFLDHGVEHLRPLMRQNIADKIGMHVATVSRAVKDKYIQTPSGIIPLASFFSGGIQTQDGGEAESSKSVKLKIKKLIAAEDVKNPLSDQEIADILAKEGLDISRRTVTKYRIADGVPSTRQRRSF
ncbi:MAG TPA: RNA polymerase factor sigma-54 [Planctomycetota bacterium]|nr:RNA polymerase factor sigma-54 [Planctomycetota bacterium]